MHKHRSCRRTQHTRRHNRAAARTNHARNSRRRVRRKDQRQGGLRVGNCSAAHLTRDLHHTRKKERHYYRSQHVNSHPHTRQGFEWNAQSCWMDSSLMAMFYPDSMYNAIYHKFHESTTPFNHIRKVLVDIVRELRKDNGHPSLHNLRSILADETPMTGDQTYAFQRENELGYVFYFLQEIQKLFGVPCMRATPPYGTRPQDLYVLEMERCGSSGRDTVQTCLNRTYSKWTFEDNTDIRHMFIELIDEDRYTVQPQEVVNFQGYTWELCSMIVFDCSHFVTYLRHRGSWWLYDDTRALSHMTLKPHTFGKKYYTKGACRYQYGVQNTFFFYVRK